MASFIIRGIDPALMERVKAQAEREGLTVKDAMLKRLNAYDACDEEIVPHRFMPLLGHADEVYCTECEYHRDHLIHKGATSAPR